MIHYKKLKMKYYLTLAYVISPQQRLQDSLVEGLIGFETPTKQLEKLGIFSHTALYSATDLQISLSQGFIGFEP